jgi:uncharacterized protein
MSIIAIAVMAAALLTTPLGLPGNWIMIAVLAAGAYFGDVGALVLIACTLIAGVAELVEFLLVQRLNIRYGGSRGAFWGAIAGGIVGVIVGIPVPIIGSVLAGFAGSFAGAALVTLAQTRKLDSASRVGWGVLLGRMWAAAVKTAAGVVILVLGAAAFLL